MADPGGPSDHRGQERAVGARGGPAGGTPRPEHLRSISTSAGTLHPSRDRSPHRGSGRCAPGTSSTGRRREGSARGRVPELQVREIVPEKSTVTSEEPVRMLHGMGSNEEVWKDPALPAPLSSEHRAKHFPGEGRAPQGRRHELQPPVTEELQEPGVLDERGTDFRRYALADDQPSFRGSFPERPEARGGLRTLPVNTSRMTELSTAVIIPLPPGGSRPPRGRPAGSPYPSTC